MRYALIGCGRISVKHIEAAARAGFEIAALCDLDTEKAHRLKASHKAAGKASIHRDYIEMLDSARPDIAAIATDSGSHGELAAEIIRRGIAVIIEKPIALSSAEAAQIALLGAEKNVPVAVCHQNRFNPAVIKLKEAIAANELGAIHYASAAVRWNRNNSYYKTASWRGKWASDGGVLMNQCIHAADMLIHILGRPVSVAAIIERKSRPIEAEDFGAAIIRFEGGKTAILEGTSLTEPGNIEETVFISGSRGSARLGGLAMNKLELWKPDYSGHCGCAAVEPVTPVKDVYGGGHIPLYTDMAQCLKTGRHPAISAESGILAAELVLSIYRSAKCGSAVGFMEAPFSTSDMAGFFPAASPISPIAGCAGR